MLETVASLLKEIGDVDMFINSDKFQSKLDGMITLMPNALSEVNLYLKNREGKGSHAQVKLCVSQLFKTLPLFSSIMKNKKTSNKEIIKHLLEKTTWCFKEIIKICAESFPMEDDKNVDSFVQLMDSAVNLVNIDKYCEETFKNLTEDLLCQAITIAKLAIQPDYKEITLACKNVLRATQNSSATNSSHFEGSFLYKDHLLSVLDRLERTVNSAVLRMVLHTLSEPYYPLKTLVKQCFDNSRFFKHQASDLHDLITVFDLHCDRIQLVGSFAIACSEDENIKLEMKSCLASLEFVESALVPAILSCHNDVNNLEKRAFLKFLCDSWQQEVLSLSNQINNTIDTLAFTEVVLFDAVQSLEIIKEEIMDNKYNKRRVEEYIEKCVKLAWHIHTSAESEIKNDKFVTSISKDLFIATKKCKQILQEDSLPSLLKQLDGLVSLVENLLHQLQSITTNRTSRKISFVLSSLEVLSNSAQFDETVEDISAISSGADGSLIEKDWLKEKFLKDTEEGDLDKFEKEISNLSPYFTRANDMTILKSTFYCKTPSRSNRKMGSFQNNNKTLSVSDFLDNVSGVEGSFTSQEFDGIQTESITPPLPDFEGINYYFNKSSRISSQFEIVPSDISNTSKDTLERLKDLSLLESRIHFLTNAGGKDN